MAEEAELIDQETGSTLIESPSKMNFALVIFRGIEDLYTVGTDVECRYTVSGGLEVGTRDWVGLYKVGWRNQVDFFCYEWSPQPRSIGGPGSDLTSSIQFLGTNLPKDDGEFYQFCYVTGEGNVRGASTPFQFKQYMMDELIEVEDENGELLIIKTKTAMLEEQLKKASETRLQLKQEIQILENEREILRRSEAELQKKLQMQRELNVMADEKIREMQELTSDVNNQNDHLQGCISSVQERIEIMNQEKLSMENRLDDSDRYIGSLQEKIKALVNEKDTLTGRVRSLEEEKELYKGHFTTSEDTLQSYVQELERVKMVLIEEQTSKSRARKELERLEAEMSEQCKRNEALTKTTQSEKENIAYLTERMRNAEDKLSAAEHCKMMLNEEVLTLKLAYEKTSADLEKSRLLVDRMSSQQASSVSSLQATIDDLSREVGDLEAALIDKDKEESVLEEELEACRNELRKERELSEQREAERKRAESVETEGPLYALLLAQDTLKERYSRSLKRNEELQRAFDQTKAHMRELLEVDDDQKKEISSLRDRLLMGQEAYKEKYIEWERLETEMYRMRLNKHGISASRESMFTSTAGDSSTSESLPQVKDDKHQAARARKYKHLYLEQKTLVQELLQRVRDKDFEMERLRLKIAATYPPAEYATIARPKPNSSSSVSKPRVENIGNCSEYAYPFQLSHAAAPQMSHAAAPLVSHAAAPPVTGVDVTDGAEDGHRLLAPPLKPLPAPIIPERLHAARMAPVRHCNADIGLNQVSTMLDSWTVDSSSCIAATAEQATAATAEQSTAEQATAAVAPPHSNTALNADGNASLATTVSQLHSVTTAEVSTTTDGPLGDEEKFEDACGDLHDVLVTCPCCEFSFTVEREEDAANRLDEHFNSVHSAATIAPPCTVCPICGVNFSASERHDQIHKHVESHFPS